MQSDFPHTDATAEPPESSGSESLSEERAQQLSSSDELTAEEWAELERATNPNLLSEPLTPHGAGWVQAADQAEAAVPPEPDEPAPVREEPSRSLDPVPAAPVIMNQEPGRATVEHPHDQSLPAAPGQDADSEPPKASAAVRETASEGESELKPDGESGLDAAVEPVPTFDGGSEQGPGDSESQGEAQSGEEPTGEPEPEPEPEPQSTLSMPLPRVIAVANQKGGVGKTTTTVNVAACLAEQGYRTLLVDLDPQANASTGLGLEPRELEHSIYHVMLHGQEADSCIEPTEVKNLFVLPSSLDLAGAEIELVAMMSREHRLRLAIESVIDDYDYVLIDCPPSLGLLTINALTAANEVLVPIQCEYYALEGLGQLMRNVELVKAKPEPRPANQPYCAGHVRPSHETRRPGRRRGTGPFRCNRLPERDSSHRSLVGGTVVWATNNHI